MILTRRQMLGCGAAVATAAASIAYARPAPKPIGLQLYTVREPFRKDPVGTLERIARVGYREVEFGGGGYDTMNPEVLRRAMVRLGLSSPSLHVGYEALSARLDASIEMANALGADTVVLPFMGPEYRNETAWRAAVANMNRIAERLRRRGLGFAYHNHDFEFASQPGGLSLFDQLVAERDPALVKFEIDLFWAVKAGQDPKAMVRRLSGQIYAYHVKDMARDGSMTSVGAGTIDFAAIFALDAVAGVSHLYVENDQAPPPYLPDIAASFRALRALGTRRTAA